MMYLHERVGLLLLLENSGRGLIVLWQVSKSDFGKPSGNAYILVLSAGWISADFVSKCFSERTGGEPRTLIDPPSALSDLAQPTCCVESGEAAEM